MQAALDYEKYLSCVKGWLADLPMDRRVEWATVMLADIQTMRIGTVCDSAMRCILLEVLRVNCESYVNPKRDIDGIAFNIEIHLQPKTKNICIVGLQLTTVSNQISYSTSCPATTTER